MNEYTFINALSCSVREMLLWLAAELVPSSVKDLYDQVCGLSAFSDASSCLRTLRLNFDKVGIWLPSMSSPSRDMMEKL